MTSTTPQPPEPSGTNQAPPPTNDVHTNEVGATEAPAGSSASSSEPFGVAAEASNDASAPTVTVPGTAPTASVAKLRPRFGTIFWGVLLFTAAAYTIVSMLVPAPLDPTLWLLGSVIAIGLGLVVAGVAAAARRAG